MRISSLSRRCRVPVFISRSKSLKPLTRDDRRSFVLPVPLIPSYPDREKIYLPSTRKYSGTVQRCREGGCRACYETSDASFTTLSSSPSEGDDRYDVNQFINSLRCYCCNHYLNPKYLNSIAGNHERQSIMKSKF